MPRVGLTREKIIDRAVQLSNLHGFEQLNLGGLARDLQVQPPGLYKHTSGLDDIRRSVSLLALRDLGDVLRDSVVGQSGDAAVRSMAQAFRRFAHDSPGAFTATAKAPPKDDGEWQVAANRIVEIVAKVLRGMSLRPDRAVHAIRILRSALFGFVSLEQGRGFGLPEDLETTFNALVEVSIVGLKAAFSETT